MTNDKTCTCACAGVCVGCSVGVDCWGFGQQKDEVTPVTGIYKFSAVRARMGHRGPPSIC